MVRFLVFICCATVAIQSFAQPLRYNKTIFTKTDTIKNLEYAVANWLNSPVGLLSEYNVHSSENKTEARPLFMDIYKPHDDTITKRPAIIFTFSGGFLIGSRHHDDIIAFCDSFAQRGYVTATIDYRIGMAAEVSSIFGIPYNVSVSELNGTRSVYRAIQDSRAAVRFLKHNANTYGIDTTKIYMVGSSAGALVALHNLYMDKNSEIPKLALGEPSLGNLDSIGVQGHNGQADAVVSIWGALQSPALIENERKPVLLIHGEKDSILYFKKGMPLKSLMPDLDALEFYMPETYGGFCIDTALSNRNIPHKTYFVPNKKHEFYGVSTGEFGEDGPNQYWDTVHWKISDFLFDIFKPEAEFSYESDDLALSFFDQTQNTTFSEWDFGDGNSAHGVRVLHTYSEAGEYKVNLTTCNDNMACATSKQTIKIDRTVSVNNQSLSPIKVYPNPVNTQLMLKGIKSEYEYKILDLLGRIHLQKKHCYSNSIKVTSLQKGIYLVRIQTNNEILTHKIQKTN